MSVYRDPGDSVRQSRVPRWFLVFLLRLARRHG